MKITQRDYQALETAMRIGMARVPSQDAYSACHESIPRIHLAKDRQMRYRWDALHASGFNTASLYPYLNDDHIDTALRAIVAKATREA